MTKQLTSKTIVFAHGLFVNPTSWKNWKNFFEREEYTVHTTTNPSHEGNPSDMRANVHPKLENTNFEDVIQNLVKFIDALPEKPILIGHSLGGLSVQKLIE